MQNPVVRALFEIIDLLEANNIEYAVMGGLAVRALALARATNDVEITVSLQPDILLKLLKLMESECIEVPEIYQHGWLDRIAGIPLLMIKTYVDSEHSVDLDVFIAESDFQRSLIARRNSLEYDERQVWIVTPEDLKLLPIALATNLTSQI